MSKRVVVDLKGNKRELNVGKAKKVEKAMTKDKLRHLSKRYRVKLLKTGENHANFELMKGLVDNLIEKAMDENLVGYKAKELFESENEGSVKDRYVKILQLTSR